MFTRYFVSCVSRCVWVGGGVISLFTFVYISRRVVAIRARGIFLPLYDVSDVHFLPVYVEFLLCGLLLSNFGLFFFYFQLYEDFLLWI